MQLVQFLERIAQSLDGGLMTYQAILLRIIAIFGIVLFVALAGIEVFNNYTKVRDASPKATYCKKYTEAKNGKTYVCYIPSDSARGDFLGVAGASLTTLIASYLGISGVRLSKLKRLRAYIQNPKRSKFEWVVFGFVVMFVLTIGIVFVSGLLVSSVASSKSELEIIQPPIIGVMATTFIGFVIGSFGILFQTQDSE